MVATSDILICDNVFMNRDTPVFACDTYVKLKKDRSGLLTTRQPHCNKTFIYGSYHIQNLRLDISAHICPKRYIKELQYVFPKIDLLNVIAVPTMQFARNELVNLGDEIEVEKDQLLEKFMSLAKVVCDEFAKKGYFADYIDPCSGLPMVNQDGNKVFSEVDSAEQLLGYSVMNAGCCKVLLHPQWGSAVYPATLFTTAPSALVIEILGRLREGEFDKKMDNFFLDL